MPASHLQWRAMTPDDLDQVMALEQASHSHPWSRGNFADSLATGCYMPALWHQGPHQNPPQNPQQGPQCRLLGYLVAMPGVEEAHLLTLTVAAACRGRGLGQLLMQAMHTWAQQQGAAQVWLEVRESNLAAQALYARLGYEPIAVRKNYYPLEGNAREHALIMRKRL
ncbi:ribosomal-protein-alanine N-acetyltransferase [Comamonadaceae bacterium OH3737_COT-264]|nr:ribosomal-protein-alanine N-acetyltransferase [Comamonadaceae bacterium OH3737_COT-264]